MTNRHNLLHGSHVQPLMLLIESLRQRGLQVPNVDPNDGGVNALVLILLETPGPQAVSSGFVSQDNPDPSARNMKQALHHAGLARCEVVLWNVVPHCISTADYNRNATIAQIRDAVQDTQAFVDRLVCLCAAVFSGRRAQEAMPLLSFPPDVSVLCTYHTGAQSFNRPQCRAYIFETFKKGADIAHGK